MTEQAEDIADPHKIRRYLSVLAPLGIQDGSPELHLELPPEMDTFAGSFLHRQGIDPGRRILYVNLRTTWPDKNWLPESFAAALQAVPADVQLVFCGAKGDQPYIDTVQRLLGRPMAKDATPARADPARPNVSTVVCQESTAPATAPSDAVADEAIAAGPAIAIPMPVAIRATEATISAVLIGFCLTQFQALRH